MKPAALTHSVHHPDAARAPGPSCPAFCPHQSLCGPFLRPGCWRRDLENTYTVNTWLLVSIPSQPLLWSLLPGLEPAEAPSRSCDPPPSSFPGSVLAGSWRNLPFCKRTGEGVVRNVKFDLALTGRKKWRGKRPACGDNVMYTWGDQD